MKNITQQIYLASKIVFENKKYFLALVIFSITFFFLFVLVPVKTIPGNDTLYQISLYTTANYFFMFVLSILIGVAFAFQVYIIKNRKDKNDLTKAAINSSASGVSGIFAAIVGTAACSSCLAALFALFGFGMSGVLFVLNYQLYFVSGAIFVILLSIYLASKSINRVCITC